MTTNANRRLSANTRNRRNVSESRRFSSRKPAGKRYVRNHGNSYPRRSNSSSNAALENRIMGYQIAVIVLACLLVFAATEMIKSNIYQSHLDEVRSMPTVEVIVEKGDTVWNIAENTGIDTIRMQDLVNIIMEKNPDQKAGQLEIGATIEVPARI